MTLACSVCKPIWLLIQDRTLAKNLVTLIKVEGIEYKNLITKISEFLLQIFLLRSVLISSHLTMQVVWRDHVGGPS